MTVTMTELMRCVRNCFVSGAVDGSWRIEAGAITGQPSLRPGWIAIEGRGAFLLDEGGAADGLPDGDWEGVIWLLDPPADFLRLLEEINGWLAAQGRDAMTAGAVTHRRESFGAYSTETSYSTGSASSGSWEAAFAGRMLPYRRMFPEVRL